MHDPHRASLTLFAALLAATALPACQASMGLTPPGGNGPDGREPVPACPVDPDCAIGGDCSLYECPDYWECEQRGTRVHCESPGPDYPDDSHQWDCRDEGGRTICEGDDLPDGGGSDEWNCMRRAEFVECVKNDPDYPDGGGDIPWDCHFTREMRVCDGEGDLPDDPGTPPGGGGGGDIPDDGGDIPHSDCEFGDDACDPGVCRDDIHATALFRDDRDGEDDGQIYALNGRDPEVSCASLWVGTTGYYRLYDAELAESCSTQLDETGYMTVGNSCNPDGWAMERNIGDRYVVPDPDNTGACTVDADCGPGRRCRPADGRYGPCCIPDSPVFMGTFLLMALEPNVICLHHWCPEWHDMGGPDDGTTTAGCDGINSIHFRLDTGAFLCADDSIAPRCGG